MSDTVLAFHGKTMTRREIEIARYAFERGCIAWQRTTDLDPSWPGIVKAAADTFPLPTVTRPRVVHDDVDKCEYRAVGGMIQRRDEWQEWYVVNDTALSERRIRLWADLLANPTEECEEVTP